MTVSARSASQPIIALHAPEIGERELERVRDCLARGWISSAGAVTDEFECAVARYVGVRHAVAVSSGTAALHTALLVAGVGPDDEVVVPSLTFIASVNAIAYCGARPVFVDVSPDTWTLDPDKTVTFLRQECDVRNGRLVNRATGRRVAAVMAVHVLGHPVDLDPILEAARARGVITIEDAAESLGAAYRDRKVGGLADLACLSFNGSKVVTTGGGGMVLTDSDGWAARARHLTTQARSDDREYVHDEVGYNYRLPAINAAIGIAQMERLPEILERKRRVAERYREGLAGLPLVAPAPEAAWARSTFWLYTVRLKDLRLPALRDRLLDSMRQEGIEARPLWRPIHLAPMYAAAQRYHLDHTEDIYRTAVSLPSSPGLVREDQRLVISVLERSLAEGTAGKDTSWV